MSPENPSYARYVLTNVSIALLALLGVMMYVQCGHTFSRLFRFCGKFVDDLLFTDRYTGFCHRANAEVDDALEQHGHEARRQAEGAAGQQRRRLLGAVAPVVRRRRERERAEGELEVGLEGLHTRGRGRASEGERE